MIFKVQKLVIVIYLNELLKIMHIVIFYTLQMVFSKWPMVFPLDFLHCYDYLIPHDVPSVSNKIDDLENCNQILLYLIRTICTVIITIAPESCRHAVSIWAVKILLSACLWFWKKKNSLKSNPFNCLFLSVLKQEDTTCFLLKYKWWKEK